MDDTSEGHLWLRRFQPSDTPTVRLVCFPHAGGAASYFLPVARALAPEVDVLAVQYPGRQDRRNEPGIGDLTVLADRSAHALKGELDRPLALFGHSMGALVAYEVARRLAHTSPSQPVHLFVSGRRAPTRHRVEDVHLRGDDAIIKELQSLGGTDPQMLADPEVREMILGALRSDYRAVETYRHVPGERLLCPVTALTGDHDPKTTVAEARAWQDQAPKDGFTLHVLPGDHFFLAPRATEVVALLREHLLTAPDTLAPARQ
ncbi:alpha/beta fold hydrolase [Streptomyces sp. NPDC052051]|uniref:thioesterase II family protein n=1 Tax=Streptomyces sp. NPDC052051 TaxID=3154649 RepID=UPI00341A8A8C